jgi:hypothetical protein
VPSPSFVGIRAPCARPIPRRGNTAGVAAGQRPSVCRRWAVRCCPFGWVPDSEPISIPPRHARGPSPRHAHSASPQSFQGGTAVRAVIHVDADGVGVRVCCLMGTACTWQAMAWPTGMALQYVLRCTLWVPPPLFPSGRWGWTVLPSNRGRVGRAHPSPCDGCRRMGWSYSRDRVPNKLQHGGMAAIQCLHGFVS